MDKSADAYRTISEVAEELDLPQHVLRFWETRFAHIKPLKRAGGRRFYRPQDIELLRAIKQLLYGQGYTIKGVQRILKEQGARAIAAASQSGVDFSSRSAADAPLLPDESASCDAADAQMPDAPSFETPATSSRHWQADEAPSTPWPEGAATNRRGDPELASPNFLLIEDIAARLRAVLTELDECERILEGVRRA